MQRSRKLFLDMYEPCKFFESHISLESSRKVVIVLHTADVRDVMASICEVVGIGILKKHDFVLFKKTIL